MNGPRKGNRGKSRKSRKGASRPADRVRVAAARLLARWNRGGIHADELIREFEAHPPQDPPWVYDESRRLRELVFSSVRLRDRYEHIIAQTAQSPERLQPTLRAVLWVGLHEIIVLSTPDHAAVDQAVLSARELGHAKGSGFVNALLRRVLREGVEGFFPAFEEDPIGHVSSWLSHPRWLVERWAKQHSNDELRALCESDNRRAPIVLRCAPGERESIRARGVELEWELIPSPLAPDALRVETRVPAPLLLREFGSAVTIQDEAAQLVAPLLLPESPRRVIDLCAAPGGKAGHLAQLLPEARVIALDRAPRRAAKLLDLGERLGRTDFHVVAADGIAPPVRAGEQDAVLLDAPCTGTGVLARRHDARWHRRARDLRDLPVLQRALLLSAIETVRPGGIIVYSTCSLEPEENDRVVDRVLRERPELEEIGVQGRVPEAVRDGKRLRVWPHRHDCDGAFAAVLRRKESRR